MILPPPQPPIQGKSVYTYARELYRWLTQSWQELQRVSTVQDTRRLGLYASQVQFGCHATDSQLGVPFVRVYKGYHLLPSGAYAWPSSGESDDIAITGAGWLITRQAKSGPGAVTVVFQATQANPSSTTHYESDICRVTYESVAVIGLIYMNPGERNFVATI